MKYVKSSLVLAGLMAAAASANPNPCGDTKVVKHVTVINGNGTDLRSGAQTPGNSDAAMAAVQDALAGLNVPGLAAAVIASGSTETGAAGPKPWLGVGTDEIGDDVRSLLPEGVAGGLIVRHVDEDSPAAKAGIQVNDILLKLDDQILLNATQFRQLVQMRKEGEKAAISGLRKGKEVKFDASPVMKEQSDEDSGVKVIRFGGLQPDIKMELPPEFRKLMESGGATMFSTSIVIRSQGNTQFGGSGSGSGSGGTRMHKSGGSSSGHSPGSSSSKSSTGISATTENGKTTITYNGEEVFSGTTSGAVSTKATNNNGEEYAAAYDGDKVIWENKSGAADRLKN